MKKVLSLSILTASIVFAGTTIKEGWNLVGAITSIDPATISCAKTIWKFNKDTNKWNLYTNSNYGLNSANEYGFTEITSLNSGDGFWIDAACEDTLNMNSIPSIDTNVPTVGYFVDSPVEGLEYNTTSGLNGVTDKYGRFKYNYGDTVEFSLGKITLGTSEPKYNYIKPTDLTDNNDTVTLMLQTLQSLDQDSNASNGITIPPSVPTALNDLNTTINFDTLTQEDLIKLDNQHNLGLDKDFDGQIDIDAEKAHIHFNNSVDNIKKGHKPDEDIKYQNNKDSNESNNNFNLSSYPITENLSQDLKNSLAYMGNEERLAYDIYTKLYNYHMSNNSLDIKQLINIATKSESKHISIVQDIVSRYNLGYSDLTDVNKTIVKNNNLSKDNMISGIYDIPVIQNLYNTLYNMGIEDQISALKVGCMVEVTDINDLDKYITQAQNDGATDIEAAFNILRDGSYKHYWAFDKALKNIGIENGCYYEGDTLLSNKNEIYPKDDNEAKKNGSKKYGKEKKKDGKK